MLPCSRAPRCHATPFYRTAMEDLDKLLHDTGITVERILNRYTLSTEKSSALEVLDVRTSLSMGIMPTISKNGQEAHTDILNNGNESFSSLGPSQVHASSGESVYSHDVQNWFSQKRSEISGLTKFSLGAMSGASNHRSDLSDEVGLRVFLEEIKKTVRNWMSRQRALLQDRPSTIAPDDTVLFNPGLRLLPNSMPSMLSSQIGQSSITIMSPSEAARPTENEGEVHQNQAEKEMGHGGVHHKQMVVGKREGLAQHQNQKEEVSGGKAALQIAKDEGHIFSATEKEKLSYFGEGVDGIASQLQSNEQTMTATIQETSDNAAILSLEKTTIEVNPSPTQGMIVTTTTANIDIDPSMAGNEGVSGNCVVSAGTKLIEMKLPLAKWTPPPKSAAKSIDKSLSISRGLEVIMSPTWLPEGWVTEVKTRGSGNSAGSKDKYYVDPISHRRFRSRKEVIAFLERGKPTTSDSPETSPVKKFPVLEVLPSLTKKSPKKAKHKESVAPSVSALSPSIVPSIVSPGLLGNMYMPPFRTAQPSEWLVYESLASLPFPMFDPFYYTDFGVNKSNSIKSSHVPTRPWFFSGPEASWSPFMDRSSIGKSGDKLRDYQSFYSMPPYFSEAGSKPSSGDGIKKSAKRKSSES